MVAVCWKVTVAPTAEISPHADTSAEFCSLFWGLNEIICAKNLAQILWEAWSLFIPLLLERVCCSLTPYFIQGSYLCFCRCVRGQVRPSWDPGPQVPPAGIHHSQESLCTGCGTQDPEVALGRGWHGCGRNSFCFHGVSALDSTAWFLGGETENECVVLISGTGVEGRM